MTDYLASYNSVLDADDAVITSISGKDPIGLADALEAGACRANSIELEYLLAAARGEAIGVKLVRKRGRPKAGAANVFEPNDVWLRDGLPDQIRAELITQLRTGAIGLRDQKALGTGSGRRRTTICPLAAAGAEIHLIALKLAQDRRPDLRVDYDLKLLPVPAKMSSGR